MTHEYCEFGRLIGLYMASKSSRNFNLLLLPLPKNRVTPVGRELEHSRFSRFYSSYPHHEFPPLLVQR